MTSWGEDVVVAVSLPPEMPLLIQLKRNDQQACDSSVSTSKQEARDFYDASPAVSSIPAKPSRMLHIPVINTLSQLMLR